MIFDLTEQKITLFLLFFGVAILAAALLYLIIIKLSKKGTKTAFPFPESANKNDLFFRISDDFKEQLTKLIEKEVKENMGWFKEQFQESSQEIIKNYKNHFENSGQEIQKVIEEFSRQTVNEISKLSKFTQEKEDKIAQESADKIVELNNTAKNEILKIQEINLKVQDSLMNDVVEKFSKIYQSTSQTLNEKAAKTEKEIENYKRERLKEIDRKIYRLVGQVAKKVIGRTIDLTNHEELVIEALEKAKKSIF